MSGNPISRRRFVRRAAGAAGALATGGVLANAATGAISNDSVGPFQGTLPDGTPLLSGVIRDLLSPSMLSLERDGRVRVLTNKKTRLWRDRRVSLEDFRPGDYVAAQGMWADPETFMATVIEPTYFNLAGTVESIRRDVIVTSAGTANLTAATKLLSNVGEVRPLTAGDLRSDEAVSILVRREAARVPLVAVRVSLA